MVGGSKTSLDMGFEINNTCLDDGLFVNNTCLDKCLALRARVWICVWANTGHVWIGVGGIHVWICVLALDTCLDMCFGSEIHVWLTVLGFEHKYVDRCWGLENMYGYVFGY